MSSRRFTLDDVAFLTSDRGQTALSRYADVDLSESNLLRLIPKMRPQFTPNESSALLETLQLRRKATAKFGADAALMLFTGSALEQASAPQVRRYRSQQLDPTTTLTDIGCGIGSDALRYAAAGITVTGVDVDPVRIAMAAFNAAQLEQQITFMIMDVTMALPPTGDHAFFDPARRDALGNRIFDVERYQPPLALLHRWQGRYRSVHVKLAPGVDRAQLAPYGGGVTFISVNGELKEAVLDTTQISPAVAVRLTDDAPPLMMQSPAVGMDAVELGNVKGWLHEPDAAILRAELVQPLAHRLNAHQLDSTIAYLITPTPPQHDVWWRWVRSWEILDWMPFNLKRLKAYIKQHRIGHVTVKKRGSPITPEALIGKLKLKGDVSRTLILTRLRTEPIVIICRDYQPE